MKTRSQKSIATVGLLAFLALPALGQESFPVLRPEGCGTKSVKVPAGANAQYYLSKDCKTAYILPSELSPLRVSRFRIGQSVNEESCGEVIQMNKRVKSMFKRLEQLEVEHEALKASWEKRLDRATVAEMATLEEVKQSALSYSEKYMEKYKEILSLAQQREPYGSMEGVVMNVNMSLGHGKNVMAYIDANKDLDMRFEAARISDGVLSFGTTTTNNNRIKAESVIGAYIPGLNANGKNSFSDSNHLLMNGGLAGAITLSQPHVCNKLRSLDPARFSPELLTKNILETSGFVANYTYTVPVTTNIDFTFKASTTPTGLYTEFNETITAGKFSRAHAADTIFKGKNSTQVKLTYKDGGVEYTALNDSIARDERLNVEEENIFTLLYAEGMEQFVDKVLRTMEQKNLIQVSATSPVQAVEGGETVEQTVLRKCHYKPRFLRKSKHVCKTYTEPKVNYVSGVAWKKSTVIDDSEIEHSFEVTAEKTFDMRHTTALTESNDETEE